MNQQDPIHIWIVEDNSVFRDAVKSLLDSTNGIVCEKAVSSVESILPDLEDGILADVILLDIGLPGMNGIDGLSAIKAISPTVKIIMLTIYDDDDNIIRAICAGASGYLLKSDEGDRIIQSIFEVLEGGAPINGSIAKKVLGMFSLLAAPRGNYGLTDKEKEILAHLVDGKTKRQIADDMFLSHHTVNTHIKNIYTKLQVHTQSGAVAKVLKENLL